MKLHSINTHGDQSPYPFLQLYGVQEDGQFVVLSASKAVGVSDVEHRVMTAEEWCDLDRGNWHQVPTYLYDGRMYWRDRDFCWGRTSVAESHTQRCRRGLSHRKVREGRLPFSIVEQRALSPREVCDFVSAILV